MSAVEADERVHHAVRGPELGRGVAVGDATTFMPAPRAAAIPGIESSKATHSSGARPGVRAGQPRGRLEVGLGVGLRPRRRRRRRRSPGTRRAGPRRAGSPRSRRAARPRRWPAASPAPGRARGRGTPWKKGISGIRGRRSGPCARAMTAPGRRRGPSPRRGARGRGGSPPGRRRRGRAAVLLLGDPDPVRREGVAQGRKWRGSLFAMTPSKSKMAARSGTRYFFRRDETRRSKSARAAATVAAGPVSLKKTLPPGASMIAPRRR